MIKKPSRTTFYTGAATALSLLGDQALYALLPIYFSEIGLLPIQVGILLSANRWIRLFTNHLAEQMVSQQPVRPLFLASLVVGALLTGLYAFVSSFVVLLLARCVWGLCWSFIRHISVLGVAATSEPAHLGQMMGYYNGISRIGSVAGIVLGGLLFDSFGFTTTLLLFSVISLFALPLGFLSGVHADHIAEGVRNPGEVKAHRALLVCGFCVGSVGPGLLMSTLGFILLSRYGTEVSLFGAVVGIASLNGLILGSRWVLDAFGAPVYGALMDRTGPLVGVSAAFLAGLLAMLMVSNVSGLIPLSAGIIVFFICGTALATALSAEASRRGSKVFSRYATAGDLGAAVGPVIGWTAYEFLDTPDFTFVLGAMVYLLGLVAAIIAFKVKVPGRER